MNTLRAIILCVILCIAVAGCGSQSEPANPTTSYSENATEKEKEKGAQMSTDQAGGSVATLNTNHGSIRIQLFPNEAPKTVDNFVKLSKDGFYDGVIFHRVIPNFMIQGGDPTGTGMGGPGYQFEDEFHPSLTFDSAGYLAMANAGPNTNGSQFFITTVPTPHLNGAHTIFGRVLEGQDIADAISNLATGAGNKPLEDVTIESIQIE